MSKKGGRQRIDHYTKSAKESGFPARSVFKLQEIQNKYRILSKGDSVLDIGAAPGSWALYASSIIGSKGQVISVDLKPIDPAVASRLQCPADGCITGDICSEETEAAIAEHGPYTAILSDAAPNTTGNRTVDTGRSFTLVMKVLDYARKRLSPGGNLVVKVFQGGDEQEVFKTIKEMFTTAKAYKPKASRAPSMEVYYIGIGKNQPSGVHR